MHVGEHVKRGAYLLFAAACHSKTQQHLLHVNMKVLFLVKKMVVGNEEVEEGERRRFFETLLSNWSGAI